jgi:hypothetical protein
MNASSTKNGRKGRNSCDFGQLKSILDDMELPFHLIHDTNQQQYRWTISDAVNTVKCS